MSLLPVRRRLHFPMPLSQYIGRIKEDNSIVPCFNTFYEFIDTDYRKVLEDKKVREKDF